MHLAAAYDHTHFVTMLCGIDSTICVAKDTKGRTALTYAAMNSHAEAARLVHALGVPIDHSDETDCTPLSYAAMIGHNDMCRFLLDQGAVVEARSDIQRTPLCYAARNGHIPVV